MSCPRVQYASDTVHACLAWRDPSTFQRWSHSAAFNQPWPVHQAFPPVASALLHRTESSFGNGCYFKNKCIAPPFTTSLNTVLQYAPFHPFFAITRFVSQALQPNPYWVRGHGADHGSFCAGRKGHEFRHRHPPKRRSPRRPKSILPKMHHNQPQTQPPTLTWIISQSMTTLSS